MLLRPQLVAGSDGSSTKTRRQSWGALLMLKEHWLSKRMRRHEETPGRVFWMYLIISCLQSRVRSCLCVKLTGFRL